MQLYDCPVGHAGCEDRAARRGAPETKANSGRLSSEEREISNPVGGFSRMQLPIDLAKDQEVILTKILSLLSATVDILSSDGHINAMNAMEMSQMVVQAMWEKYNFYNIFYYFYYFFII
jgi:hypothetical protein